MSFLLVVAGMFAILAMAAMAVDIVTLYTAKGEAQKAADAAALAGAKMFVTSGSTSGASGITPATVCASGNAANVMAQAAANANTVGGGAVSISNFACTGTTGTPLNPRISVTVNRTNLPTFFGRIFGRATASVSATATAEAYNNSGGAMKPQVGSVKPWLIPNCDPGSPLSSCTSATPYFINSAGGYALGAAAVSQPFTFAPATTSVAGPPPLQSAYYIGNFVAADQADICPSSGSVGCTGTLGSGGYLDNVACANRHPLTCGASIQAALSTVAGTVPDTVAGAECLIHTNIAGAGTNGQDQFSAATIVPVTITKGFNNPNTSIPANANIVQSDSIVTLPVFNWTGDPCPPVLGGACAPVTIIGFLQLGIEDVRSNGTLDMIGLNAMGCNPTGAGADISGGGLTPLPVRLVE